MRLSTCTHRAATERGGHPDAAQRALAFPRRLTRHQLGNKLGNDAADTARLQGGFGNAAVLDNLTRLAGLTALDGFALASSLTKNGIQTRA